ncbi:MAG: hypothetical protein UR79_C0001G0129 [Candidatus Campbellbacteria bacterium GW2011_GWD1_35_49]|nr:MAG: hypothetical protein UR74_C0001G0200 [Candidatus Campbellbacteria bacterium GW2011_GWD2_35_24]KKP76095.1 MAG: hypothetical protein UR75_C0001G0129 [Candidatus Campbellbacteria bacterium GW2011_GWC2_35_28]KKP77284.1 MAG: hypothetical protein UR76_C0001G0129 [Candidatus Campbellbacteria bacterium GW2011_GWC1_35_31]KKP79213.1 MAG: hypothetical protein UR79_C0001G0129 [Candidatus Campbellbacteria bacterium GW2011_GWD1_35_49]
MRIGHESLSLLFTLHFVTGSKSLSVLDPGSPSRFARYGSAFRFSTKSKQLLFSIRTAQSENHPIRVVHFGCADRIDENRSPVLSKNFVFASLQLIFTKNSRPRSLRFFLHPASFLKEKQRHGRQVRYEKIYFARFDSPYSLQKYITKKLVAFSPLFLCG